MRGRMIFMAPLAIVGIALFAGIGGLVVQQLWNWLTPVLFGWHQVTFWQALGLLALCRILFGGFGRGMHHAGSRHRSSEDKERFRQAIRMRFGLGVNTPETKAE